MGAIKEPTATLYESDFAAWAFEQAAAVQRGDWRALDVPNLVEELESMGRQQRAELRNRLAVLLMHLAKWEHQPMMRVLHGRSWGSTIVTQRGELRGVMDDSPSLASYVPEAMAAAWENGRRKAARETGVELGSFPEACPYTWEQAMDYDWMPD